MSGVEYHNAFGNGERYNSDLRSVYENKRHDVALLTTQDALKLAVKAWKDTVGPAVLVPTFMVLCVLPRFPINPKDLWGQRDRMKTMQLTREEKSQITAMSRVKMDLNRNVPAAADPEFCILQQVLVYMEKPVNLWVGTY